MSERILKILQAATHGGSSRGMSYWTQAAKCGRSVNLAAAHADLRAQQEEERSSEYASAGKLNPLMVGTYFHLLNEIDARGQADDEVWDATLTGMTPEMLEALRLFRAYKERWGSVVKKWGFTEYQVELPLPASEAGTARALEFFGHEVTGRLDGVGYIQDVDGVLERTGTSLPGPGWYLFDLKTAASSSPANQAKYLFGPQAAAYIKLWEIEHPDRPVAGMIFDETVKLKTPKYNHYFASTLASDPDLVRGIVQIGARNVAADECNYAACNSGFSSCYWFKSGKCCGR